jgi:phage shock protein A
MIFGKIWGAFKAQMNKMANWVWGADPIAQMQYEYDKAVEELKGGREGLEQYRALVERVGRQVAGNKANVQSLESKIKAYLGANQRDLAAKYALDLQTAKTQLAD